MCMGPKRPQNTTSRTLFINPCKLRTYAKWCEMMRRKTKVPPVGLEPTGSITQIESEKKVVAIAIIPLAHPLARETPIDPDLARLIDAWPTLPDAMRAGIVAMVRAATPTR